MGVWEVETPEGRWRAPAVILRDRGTSADFELGRDTTR